MKVVIKSATNSVNIATNPKVIEAAESDEAVATLEDKIKTVENDFDFLIAGIEQLDIIKANDFIDDIHADIRGFIDDVTDAISE